MRRSCLLVLLLATALSHVGATAEEKPPSAPSVFTGELNLVRYDMPRGRSDGYAPTRQLARRRDGPDAVDWPDFTLNGQPAFRSRPDEKVELKLRKGGAAASLFQASGDDIIQPGNHWFRAMEWRLGRRHIYTADKTARSANAGEGMSGRYELWTFPIVIRGEGAPVVKNVELRTDGVVIFRKAGPWRSLTLLVPANAPGKPYQLHIDGRPGVTFQAGLQPVKLGDPSERVFPLNATLAGEGHKITVTSLSRSEEFPNQKEWNADVAALAQPWERNPSVQQEARRLQQHVGVDVPHSPLTIYAAALPHGMSGGFFKKGANAQTYAAFVADTGYDAIFEQANALPAPQDPESLETRAAALADRGVKLGLQFDNNWTRPALQHPNLAFFAHTLPEWHAPLYRSLSLAAQRFAHLPNFSGITIGSDNAGYVPFWHWAPPIPDRPWGEAMIELMGTPQPKVPRAASLGRREFPFEVAAPNVAEFIKYVERYETTFRQYGYFAEAVREVDPALVFTSGSFGSSPGVGGRGGWPWASIPGRVIAEGLTTQQVYDWNELRSSKPMHNVALIDRLRSYHPSKRTWTIIDNFQFLFGREAFQRACALALTRGIQGLGTNFLANPTGDTSRPDVLAWQKELYAWIRKYGGVYARTEPLPAIGIFYGHHQAVQRRVIGGEDAPLEDQLHGSHEGKVTEALFLCHAAGWPARVITYQELMRGPLPTSMKAILLVGLDQVDPSWNWSPGLQPRLQHFLDGGGRILADDESVCPVRATKPGLRVAAYVPQSNFDATRLLLARNGDNIAKLRTAMEGVPAPIAASASPTVWAIPSECANTQYVTVVNQGFEEGDAALEMLRPADPRASKPEVWKTKGNASLHVKPQTGTLTWNTTRPIYDVRFQRKLTPEEAATVDLTTDAFRWYALPSAEVLAPEITVSRGSSGFYEAKVTMQNNGAIRGVPVQITVARAAAPSDGASVFSSTGTTARLPLRFDDGNGDYVVTATELLTGLSQSTTVKIATAAQPAFQSGVRVWQAAAPKKFATRKHVPLTVALTPEQERDGSFSRPAKALAAYYRQQGRIVSEGTVKPGGIVESLQPLKSPHRYPQWKTIATDLVLFGLPSSNVLLLDQVRAEIFPRPFKAPPPGAAEIVYTRSPFVGEYNALNIIASDAAGIAAAVKTIMAAAAKPK